MRGQKLTYHVSVQEMLELRALGLKNSEIAAQLDVSPVTVLRYIGRNDGKQSRAQIPNYRETTRPVLDADQYAACKEYIVAKKAEADKPSALAQKMYKDAQAEKAAEPPKSRLKVENIVARVTGEAGSYTIDQSKREVRFDRGEWRFDELAALIGDIRAIREEVRA